MTDWFVDLPVWWANVITVILFIFIALGCFLVPRGTFMEDAPDQSHWRDIRWWALTLIAVQLGIYSLFS